METSGVSRLKGSAGIETRIYTLGSFSVVHDGLVLSESSGRSRRMWQVFKFFLTNRYRLYSPAAVLEAISPDNDYKDPNLVLRALIHRLRRTLRSEVANLSLADNLFSTQGGYIWRDVAAYDCDADRFEALVKAAEAPVSDDSSKATAHYRQALQLYGGRYLPELEYCDWVEPQRSHYHELFTRSVLGLSRLLAVSGAHAEIVRICEQALALEYFDERIHETLMRTLMDQGAYQRARTHYSEMSTHFYQEMGIKPSVKLRDLYRHAAYEESSFELDLSNIQENLSAESVKQGAYFCDAELFRYFYNLERARMERNGSTAILVLLTLASPAVGHADSSVLRRVMQRLQDVITSRLRKGDVVTRRNEAQFLLLMPGLTREQAERVLHRILAEQSDQSFLEDLVLYRKVQTILPADSGDLFIAAPPGSAG